LAGEITYAPCLDNVIVTRTANNSVEWLDFARAKTQRVVKTGKKWTAKSVASSNLAYLAVSHFGSCSIYDVSTGDIIAEVISPDDTSEMYPLTPVAFFGKEDEWLLLRINQERILTLCNWRNSAVDMICISNVGGTISDNAIKLSPDEKFLVCWPFGYLELYDFTSIKKRLLSKVSLKLKWECILVRQLILQERASPVATGSPNKMAKSKFYHMALGVLICDAFRQVIQFL
jgi:hypothetical protein